MARAPVGVEWKMTGTWEQLSALRVRIDRARDVIPFYRARATGFQGRVRPNPAFCRIQKRPWRRVIGVERPGRAHANYTCNPNSFSRPHIPSSTSSLPTERSHASSLVRPHPKPLSVPPLLSSPLPRLPSTTRNPETTTTRHHAARRGSRRRSLSHEHIQGEARRARARSSRGQSERERESATK